jgi:ABC-type sugar transport system substrate-binding protein
MKRRDLIALAVVLGVVMPAFTGCAASDSSASAHGKKGTIAFSPMSAQIPLLQGMSDVIKNLVGEEGYGYSVIDGGLDATKQVQQITQAIDNGSVGGVWVIPVAAESMTPVIERAQKAKVPLVLQAAPEDFGLKGAQPGVVFISPKFKDFGQAIGEAAVKCMESKKAGGSDVLLATAPDTTAGSGDIKDGVKAGLGSVAAPTATIEAGDIATAQTKVSQVLISHPDTKVVVALSNETALGALGAYKAAGKTPACMIVGGGNDKDVDAAQKSGEITTLVSWDSTGGIHAVWDAVKKLLADPTAKGAVIEQPFKAATSAS